MSDSPCPYLEYQPVLVGRNKSISKRISKIARYDKDDTTDFDSDSTSLPWRQMGER